MSLTLPNTKRWYLIFGLWLLPLIYMAYLIAINQSGLGAEYHSGSKTSASRLACPLQAHVRVVRLFLCVLPL